MNIELLGERTRMEITSFRRFIQALENRRAFFKSMGAVSTDHGVSSPATHELTEGEAERVFREEALPAASGVCTIVPAALGESIGDVASLCAALDQGKLAGSD